MSARRLLLRVWLLAGLAELGNNGRVRTGTILSYNFGDVLGFDRIDNVVALTGD